MDFSWTIIDTEQNSKKAFWSADTKFRDSDEQFETDYFTHQKGLSQMKHTVSTANGNKYKSLISLQKNLRDTIADNHHQTCSYFICFCLRFLFCWTNNTKRKMTGKQRENRNGEMSTSFFFSSSSLDASIHFRHVTIIMRNQLGQKTITKIQCSWYIKKWKS